MNVLSYPFPVGGEKGMLDCSHAQLLVARLHACSCCAKASRNILGACCSFPDLGETWGQVTVRAQLSLTNWMDH